MGPHLSTDGTRLYKAQNQSPTLMEVHTDLSHLFLFEKVEADQQANKQVNSL